MSLREAKQPAPAKAGEAISFSNIESNKFDTYINDQKLL